MRTRAVLLLIACGILAGACGTTPEEKTPPQARPIAAVSEVAGRWTGFVQDPRGTQAVTLTINTDGTWEQMSASVPPVRLTGAVQVTSGQLSLRSHATGRVATATLYEGDGRRLLIVRGDDGRITHYRAAGP
jgi:hypothetical protein